MNTIKKITNLIEKKGMQQKDFEKDLELPKNVVSEWKKGRVKPSIEHITKIAKYFNVSTDYLLGLSDFYPNENPEDLHPIYRRIRDICIENGDKIADMCVAITGSQQKIPAFEDGSIIDDYLVQICEYLDVSTDYLLGLSEERIIYDSTPLSENKEKESENKIYATKEEVENIGNKVDKILELLQSMTSNVEFSNEEALGDPRLSEN